MLEMKNITSNNNNENILVVDESDNIISINIIFYY